MRTERYCTGEQFLTLQEILDICEEQKQHYPSAVNFAVDIYGDQLGVVFDRDETAEETKQSNEAQSNKKEELLREYAELKLECSKYGFSDLSELLDQI